MKCAECGEEASAICKFCGRAVCKEHIKTDLYVSGYSSKAGFYSLSSNAVRVEDAVWCGTCHPVYKTTA